MMQSSRQRFQSATFNGVSNAGGALIGGGQGLNVNTAGAAGSFDPLQTFKEAFLETLKSQKNSNILNQGKEPTSPMIKPNEQYLNSKRRSVFSKPYDSLNEMEEFIPPVHPKT